MMNDKWTIMVPQQDKKLFEWHKHKIYFNPFTFPFKKSKGFLFSLLTLTQRKGL